MSMNTKSEEKDHTLSNLFTVLYLGYVIFMLCQIIYELVGPERMSRIGKGLITLVVSYFVAAFAIVIFAIAVVVIPPPILLLILVGIIAKVLHRRYNLSIVKKQIAIKEVEEANDRTEYLAKADKGLKFLMKYIRNFQVHLYDFEISKVVDLFISDPDLIIKFHEQYDDETRLYVIGRIVNKEIICVLSCMTEEQRKEKREIAWRRPQLEQRAKQLKINNEQKQARKEAQFLIQTARKSNLTSP
jgi:hypothetical protein